MPGGEGNPSSKALCSLEDPKMSKNSKTIYPSLKEFSGKNKCSESGLDPASEAELEEEAARYEKERYGPEPQDTRIFFTRRSGPVCLPPYLPPISSAPPAPLPVALVEELTQTKTALQAQITGLKQILHLQQELGDLTLEIQNLQETMTKGQYAQKGPAKASRKPQPKLTFPVMTRARARQAWDESELNSIRTLNRSARDEREPDSTNRNRNEEQESEEENDYEEGPSDSEEESPDQDEGGTSCPVYKKLKLKHLKELHSAVKNYGMNAPFTLAILEGLSGSGYLTPSEWTKVVQSVLTRGQYLTWKSEFIDKAESLAARNRNNPLSKSASSTADKLCGRGSFASEEKQLGLSPGVLAQTAQAALSAWRAVPATEALTTPLTKIIQGAQEPYAQFVGRLQEAAERILGQNESEGLLVRQLALENANSACRAAL